MRRILMGSMIVLGLIVVLQAQGGLSGKWQGQSKTGIPIVLELKTAKTELAGTLSYNGQPSKITDGKISANTFTFKAILNGQNEGFNGEVAGDAITFWPDRMGKPNAIVLKRAK